MIEEFTKIGIKGHLKQVSYYTDTKEIIDVYEEDNLILNQGLSEFAASIAVPDTNNHNVFTLVIGNDVGTGTQLNPQAAQPGYTESNQNVVYTIPSQEFFYNLDGNSVVFSATINGASVMDLYPSQPNVVYTSATLRNGNNRAITYKRFTGRTISALISVDVTWTLSFVRI